MFRPIMGLGFVSPTEFGALAKRRFFMRVVLEISVALVAPQKAARHVTEAITALHGAGTKGLYNPTPRGRCSGALGKRDLAL